MKSFKEIVKETVAEPKGEDEKRFRKQHTDNVRVFDYGSDASEKATEKYARKKPRRADYEKGSDEAAYDQAYAEEVQETVMQGSDEHLKELLAYLEKATPGSADHSQIRDAISSMFGDKYIPKKHRNVKSVNEEMTEAQKKKREEVVKELKKKKDDFKERYGDDWEDVMYATATKMAMKEETLSEDAYEEIPMMIGQLEFIVYAAKEIMEYLERGHDPEEWYQNKLAKTHHQMKTLYAYAKGDSKPVSFRGYYEEVEPVQESEEISESVIEDLRGIVMSKNADQVEFENGNDVKVDVQTANVLLKVYDALNSQNQKKFEDALRKNEKSFMKMLDFAWSKMK